MSREPLTKEGIEQVKRAYGYFPDDPAMGVIKIAEKDFVALISTIDILMEENEDVNGMLDICITEDLKNKYMKLSVRRLRHAIKQGVASFRAKEENKKLKEEVERLKEYEYLWKGPRKV